MSSVPPPSGPYGRPPSQNPEQTNGSGYGSSSGQQPAGEGTGGAWGQQGAGQGGSAWNQRQNPPGQQQDPWSRGGTQDPGQQNQWNSAPGDAGQWNQPQNQWSQTQNQWNQQQDPQDRWNNGGRRSNGQVRWGKILTFGGGGVLPLSLLAMVLGGVGVFSSASHALDDAVTVPSYKTRTMSLDSGQTYILYHAEDDPSSTCHISGPGTVDTGVDNTSYSVTKDSRSWVSQESFKVGETGSYEFSCSSGHDVMVGKPLSMAGIGGGVVALALGGIFGFLGFAALVTGIILWIVGNRRRTSAY